MFTLQRTALFLGALSALGVAQKTTAPCDDVVIFMARGNNAAYEPDGRTFIYEQTTCSDLGGKSCDYIDIVFDVTLGAPYCPQIIEGATNGINQITSFHQKCPNTKIVVFGYSEGAQVVGSILGGPDVCGGSYVPIDPCSPTGQAIDAVLIFGDVLHVPNQPYNVLSGADKGPNPRSGQSLANMNRYSSVLRSYCAAGDPVCAGGNDVQDHLDYFQIYTNDAADWTVQQINKNKPVSCPNLPSSTASSAVPTATGYGNATSTMTSPNKPSVTPYLPAPTPGSCVVVYEFVTASA